MGTAGERMAAFIVACLVLFNDTATTEIYTLSLHDALPIFRKESGEVEVFFDGQSVMAAKSDKFPVGRLGVGSFDDEDRKSTRLNSSHANISYAVFCLQKTYLLLANCDHLLHSAVQPVAALL